MRTGRLLFLLANVALFAAWLGKFKPHGPPGPTATDATADAAGLRLDSGGDRARLRPSSRSAARLPSPAAAAPATSSRSVHVDDVATTPQRLQARSRRSGSASAGTSRSSRARRLRAGEEPRLVPRRRLEVAADRGADGARLDLARPAPEAVRGDDGDARADRRPGRREGGRAEHLRDHGRHPEGRQVLAARPAGRRAGRSRRSANLVVGKHTEAPSVGDRAIPSAQPDPRSRA